MDLLERAIRVIEKHLGDKSALSWTAIHIANEMRKVVSEYRAVQPSLGNDAADSGTGEGNDRTNHL
jgi:hypothetical protein